MKIRFLGTGDMGTRRGCTSFVINNQVLFDCGFGTIRALIEEQEDGVIDVENIRVLVLSHFHIDHTGDLLYFINRREYRIFKEGIFEGKYVKEKQSENFKPLTIIAPVGFNNYLLSVYNGQIGANHQNLCECKYLDLENVTIIEMRNGDTYMGNANFSTDRIKISAFEVEHKSQTPSLGDKIPLGYVVEIDNEKIGCSGDTALCKNLIKNLPNSKTWVIDCARGKNWKTSGRHLNFNEVTEIALNHPDIKFYGVHRRFEEMPCLIPTNLIFPTDGDIVKI